MNKRQLREDALAALLSAKIAAGPKRDDVLASSEYRQAAWAVVELNEPLARWFCRRWRGEDWHTDLLQEAMLCMFQACYAWEPMRGSYCTYVVAAMRRNIVALANTYALAATHPLRRPAFLAPLGPCPEPEEEEDHPGITARWWTKWRTRQRAELARRGVKQPPIPLTDEDNVIQHYLDPTSLIADADLDMDEAVYWQHIKVHLKGALATLQPRHAVVLLLRTGLRFNSDEADSHTLVEVGRMLGITKARVHQLETKALRRLRHPTVSRPLRQAAFETGEAR